MSTILIPICNHNHSFAYINKTAEYILTGLNSLDFEKACYISTNNQVIQEEGEWDYQITENEITPICIEFSGPYSYFPTIYKECAEITTIYKLRLIYENYSVDWFDDFRKDIFKIVKLLGGDEVIYLADNNNKLATYYYGSVIEGVPYDKIKKSLIEEFGNPVTDFKDLNFDNLDYSNLTEFFLDKFLDLR